MPPRKLPATIAGAPAKKNNALAQARALIGKAFPKDESFVEIDEDSFKESRPHLPTGSIVLDYLIGGRLNRFGVRPCPGLPKKCIINLYGQESSGKCLPADTYVFTPQGVQTVGELFVQAGISPVLGSSPVACRAQFLNRDGIVESTTHFTRNGKRPVWKLVTSSGTPIKATANHPHLVMSAGGQWVWRKTEDIQVGDFLVSVRKANFGVLPSGADMAYALGVILADAHLTNGRIEICNNDPDIKTFLETKMPDLLGISYKTYPNGDSPGSRVYHYSGKEKLADFYRVWDIKVANSPGKAWGTQVRSLVAEDLRVALQGFFDCEMSVEPGKAAIEVCSASHQLLLETKLLLHSFGILSRLSEKVVKAYPGNQYWRLSMSGEEARRYADVIGTASGLRRVELDQLLAYPHDGGSTNVDSVPFCGGLLQDLYEASETGRVQNQLIGDYKGGKPKALLTYPRLRLILDSFHDCSDLNTWQRLEEIYDTRYVYDPVVSKEEEDPVATFDFAMERTHSFIANGVVTHNTTAALTAAAMVCASGGTVGYIDWENAIDVAYAKSLGIPLNDPDSFSLAQPESLEKGLAILWTMAKAGVDLIVIDSVGAGIPQASLEQTVKEKGEMGRIGLNAAKWSKLLPELKGIINQTGSCVIGISQLRKKIGGMTGFGGDDTQAQGGEAWKFYSEVRMGLKKVHTEKGTEYNALTHKVEDAAVGQTVKCRIDKCKVSAAQGKTADFYIRFGEGIDDLRSIIEITKAHGFIKTSGAWLSFERPNGTVIKEGSLDKFKAKVREVDGLWDELYTAAIEALSEKPGTFVEVIDSEDDFADLDALLTETSPEVTSDED